MNFTWANRAVYYYQMTIVIRTVYITSSVASYFWGALVSTVSARTTSYTVNKFHLFYFKLLAFWIDAFMNRQHIELSYTSRFKYNATWDQDFNECLSEITGATCKPSLSPVSTQILIPAHINRLIVCGTPSCNLSSMAVQPMRMRPCSTSSYNTLSISSRLSTCNLQTL